MSLSNKIEFQDFNAIITNTSKKGLNYDKVYVQTYFETDTAIPENTNWLIPNEVSIPPKISAYLNASESVPMYPILESDLLQGTEDIIQQSQSGNISEVDSDMQKILQRALLKVSSLEKIGTNKYFISYNYKLFPDSNNKFKFHYVLPFHGLALPNGKIIQSTVIMPLESIIDFNATKGIAENGQEINETVTKIDYTKKTIISFQYKTDPTFVIQYNY